MKERHFIIEDLNVEDPFFPSDTQLLDGQVPLPTGTMPAIDSLTGGLRGVTLLRGAPNGRAGLLAVQIAVDIVFNNPGTMFALFRNMINKWWPQNHLPRHGVQPGDPVSKRIQIWSHTINGRIPVSEGGLRMAVDEHKKRVQADRAIVVVDDLYRYRKPPKRRTWNHRLADDGFVKRVLASQRASGDAWIVVADHDMQGCFDRVIECERSPTSSIDGHVRLTIREGGSRDVVGRIDIEYDDQHLRYKELSSSSKMGDRPPS